MKKMLLMAGAAALLATSQAFGQGHVVNLTGNDDVNIVFDTPFEGTHYFTTPKSNWFIEIGGGANMPFVENPDGASRQFTANYGVGFGKWFSPYFGWRMEFQGGSIHWNNYGGGPAYMAHAKTINGNLDIMWDMFNSLGGVNSRRVFSIVPFIGVGGTFNWDYDKAYLNVFKGSNNPASPTTTGTLKRNEWLLPVSAGLQLRFRLCKYVDFFAQARASFYGDSYNGLVIDKPVDIDLTALGGFTFNLGGCDFQSISADDYTVFIDGLNNDINDLRAELATTAAALAAAQAQLPCPEVVETVVVEESAAPLLATVRFTIDSSKISSTEKVNVYNVAQWMKANNDVKVLITGYADRNTGTSSYNMALSERRAKAVYNMLVNEYGINPNRLSTRADGSNVQPYDVNNWNRIVIFTVAE